MERRFQREVAASAKDMAMDPLAQMNRTGRVLVVDDEPNVRLMLRTVLELTGYWVAEAEDGAQGLERRRDVRPDLILLDLKMPGPGGLAMLQALRDAGDETPVIILTAHGSVPDAVAAMKLGAIDFLSKPLTPEALRKAIAEVLSRQVAPPLEPTAGQPITSQVAERLTRAKRALNRRAFGEAGSLLHQAVALDPNLAEAHHLLGVFRERQDAEQHPYRGLRDWFPVGLPHDRT